MFAPFIILGFTIDAWVLVGFLGQFFFFLRLMIQWIDSERSGRSTIPIMYWYLSAMGSVMIFIYTLHTRDPVFFAGQVIAFSIYVRNIVLHRRGVRAFAE